MENKKTGGQKVFALIVYVLAVIGLAALVVGGVFGFKTLVSKFGDENDENIKTVELAEATLAPTPTPEAVETVTVDESLETAGAAETKPVDKEVVEKIVSTTTEALSDVAIPEEAVKASEGADTDVHAAPEDKKLTISFFGDSILDSFRDETGICAIVAKEMDADVYNCSVGGMCATVYYQDNPNRGEIDQMCGVGVTGSIAGYEDINKVLHGDFTARNVINEHMDEIRKSDIYIVEYGMNDFLIGRFLKFEDEPYSVFTFAGAMRTIVSYLREANPKAKIVLCEPNFVEFYRQSDGQYLGNTYNFNNGAGTQREYCDMVMNLSKPGYSDTYLFPQSLQGIDEYNVNDMLLDGVHLNEAGRALYAKNLITYLKETVIPGKK